MLAAVSDVHVLARAQIILCDRSLFVSLQQGYSPIMGAAFEGRKDAIQALMEAKADIHAKAVSHPRSLPALLVS